MKLEADTAFNNEIRFAIVASDIATEEEVFSVNMNGHSFIGGS